MPIEALSATAVGYLRAFDLVAVCVSTTGRVYISRNPTGAARAYWCKSAADAEQVTKAAWHNADVAEAARRLGIAVSPHPIVMARIKARTERIDAAIAQAVRRPSH
jgi:hypothetical protein